ncbi:MAG: hypothetical protein ABIG80_03175 [Patescibacteria group bacterium]
MEANTPKSKKIKTIIHTKDYKITGEVVAYEKYEGRISDVMNYDKRFINLTGVEIKSSDDSIFYKGNFLCLNKEAVIFFYTAE